MQKKFLKLLFFIFNPVFAGCTPSKSLASSSELVNYASLREMRRRGIIQQAFIIHPEINSYVRKIYEWELEHTLKGLEHSNTLKGIHLEKGILKIFLK